MSLDHKRHIFSKTSLSVILILLLFVLYYAINIKKTSKTIRIEVTSKSSSNIRIQDNNKFKEIQQLVEQTEKLSLDLSNEFDQDLRVMRHKPLSNKQVHRDYLYHSTNEKKICVKPYQLMVLCLDQTDIETRSLYRKTWASKRDNILTSDGLMPIEWKVVFVVDVPKIPHVQMQFEAEKEKHNDVIGFTGEKGPRKEVLKLMTALEWADYHCDYSFLVKMSNGTFLNTPKLFSFLRDPRVPATELYGGRVVYEKNNTIEFHTRNKRLLKGYPRFIETAFIISFDVVDKIIAKFHWTRPHKEVDVYIGELVLQCGIDVWPISNFIFEDSGKCERFNLDGILINKCTKNCTEIFNKQSLRIIPEI